MKDQSDQDAREREDDQERELHLSDVEFRAECIYFIVLDRFARGSDDPPPSQDALSDPTRTEWRKYWGGNLQGLIDKLDYRQGLGVTAIWVTPLFEQIESPSEGQAPLHGYWTSDFKRLNRRWVGHERDVRLFDTDDTLFDQLLSQVHERGIKFVLDVVCNHSAPRTEKGKGLLYDDGTLVADFDNDPEGWYLHNGEVTDWDDEWQIQNCELAGLATFNPENYAYRCYIKDSLCKWLQKGVDAVRFDTAKHKPMWFWQELTSDMRRCNPDLFIFGEWIYSHPDIERSVRFANRAAMSILDFGLAEAIRDCLGRGKDEGFEAIQKILDQDTNYRSATELVTFFENHDMPRLQSLNPEDGVLELALTLLLTTRGIPCLFYGCEQYLHDDTDGGEDPYNRPMMVDWNKTPAYHLIQRLAEERRLNPAIQWGGQWPRVVEPDLYIYERRFGASTCLVALNRKGSRSGVVEDCSLQDGTYTCLVNGDEHEISDDRLSYSFDGPSALVLAFHQETEVSGPVTHVQINSAPASDDENVFLMGDAPELGEWDPARALPMEQVNTNTWFGIVEWKESAGKEVAYKFVILNDDPDVPPFREPAPPRLRLVVDQQVSKWRDIWRK